MATQNAARTAKTTLISEVKGRFDKMTSAVFLDYQGMTVETATKLRVKFREAGVEYKVIKNTLVKQALKSEPYADKLSDVLVGMTGIAWSYEDPSAAAKVAADNAKAKPAADKPEPKPPEPVVAKPKPAPKPVAAKRAAAKPAGAKPAPTRSKPEPRKKPKEAVNRDRDVPVGF